MADKTPFQVQPRLTQIALAVVPKGMIADQVLKRVPVPAEQFKYTKFDTKENFTVPDTTIGRTGRANEVEFNSRLVDGSTEDYGLEDPVPLKDLETAQANGAADPMAIATEKTTNLVDLAREKRVAETVMNLNNYPSNQRATLSGTGQWSHADSDPEYAINTAMDAMLVRPNTLVLGRPVLSWLRRHPKVVAACFPMGGNAVTGGRASLEALRDLLELEQILVGDVWASTSAKGQAASYGRLWGKDAALLYLTDRITDAMPTEPTWGFTAEFGRRQVGTYADPSRGIKGSEVVKVVEQVRELVVMPEAGHLFKSAVA
jgi:hypothetical protein